MIPGQREVSIPGLVRIKPGALDRVGVYLRRADYRRVALILSDGLPDPLIDQLHRGLSREGIELASSRTIHQASYEEARSISAELPCVQCILGLGGGKAIDAAKHIGSLSETATLAIPTSLSNDGFCSPQSSLTESGKRISCKSSMPSGVIVDTAVCLQAPKTLWRAGIGDLVSKLTAVRDWKLAFHHQNTPVDDFAALLSDASVFQFIGRPEFNLDNDRDTSHRCNGRWLRHTFASKVRPTYHERCGTRRTSPNKLAARGRLGKRSSWRPPRHTRRDAHHLRQEYPERHRGVLKSC